MGTLGKIMLFVNFLVAGGAVYFATQSYAKRQDVSSVALRHEVILRGIPLEAKGETSEDEYPFEYDLANGTTLTTIRKKVLDAHFQGADGGKFSGGGTPLSQMKEVQRVQNKAKEDLRAAGSPAAKLAILAGTYSQSGYTPGWLTTLAESFDERDFVRRLAAAQGEGQTEAASTAEAMFEKKFAAVIAPPNPSAAAAEATKLKEAGDAIRATSERVQKAATAYDAARTNDMLRKELEDSLVALGVAEKALKDILTDVGAGATRDDGHRRERIAHILMLLDPTAAWQKRVALVVGLRTYVRALGAHATRLQTMAVSANQLIVIDQAEFVEQYEQLKNLAYQRAVLLQQQVALNAELRIHLAADRDLLKQRQTQLERRQADFAQLQTEIAGVLTRQSNVESVVFALQQKVGATLDENFALEQKLEAAEQKGR